jgi:hypothetical protein
VPQSFDTVMDQHKWREQSFKDKNAGFVPRQ